MQPRLKRSFRTEAAAAPWCTGFSRLSPHAGSMPASGHPRPTIGEHRQTAERAKPCVSGSIPATSTPPTRHRAAPAASRLKPAHPNAASADTAPHRSQAAIPSSPGAPRRRCSFVAERAQRLRSHAALASSTQARGPFAGLVRRRELTENPIHFRGYPAVVTLEYVAQPRTQPGSSPRSYATGST